MSTNESMSITKRLEAVQSQYRRKHLKQKLDTIAEELETLYLRKELYESLLDISIEIDKELRSLIKDTRDLISEGSFEGVDSNIASLESRLTDYEDEMEKIVAGKLQTHRSNIESIKELNRRLEKLDSDEIEEVEDFYEPGNMLERVDLSAEESTDEKIEAVKSTARRFKSRYENMESVIFEPYFESEYGDKVTEMMSDNPPSLDSFTEDELDILTDSELSPHIELRFG